MLCLCDVFWALINSLVCWFFMDLVLFQTESNFQLKLSGTALTLNNAEGHWKWHEWVKSDERYPPCLTFTTSKKTTTLKSVSCQKARRSQASHLAGQRVQHWSTHRLPFFKQVQMIRPTLLHNKVTSSARCSFPSSALRHLNWPHKRQQTGNTSTTQVNLGCKPEKQASSGQAEKTTCQLPKRWRTVTDLSTTNKRHKLSKHVCLHCNAKLGCGYRSSKDLCRLPSPKAK